ncbi:MAG: TraR/DksA family transcriptional regulator [Planctomycetota bacterium]|nr:TraR/DksA family transcriptional regulator [Planctomycetota bacterium]
MKKKPATSAKSAPKPSKKTTTKAAGSKKKVTKKGAGGTKGAGAASGGETRNGASFLAEAKAAASRLAAAAGLRPVEPGEAAESPLVETKRLKKTPLNKRELDHFRNVLLLKRRQVAGDVSDMESEALMSVGGSLSSLSQHMADQGSDEYDQSLSLNLAESQRRLLKEIDEALERIEDKTYGICEMMGTPINKDRLEATPWAKYSLEGARQRDRQYSS